MVNILVLRFYKFAIFILLINFCSCGFKGYPTPVFPASQTQIDQEISNRNPIDGIGNDSKK